MNASLIAAVFLLLAQATVASPAEPEFTELVDPARYRGGTYSRAQIMEANRRLVERSLAAQIKEPLDSPLRLRTFIVPDYPQLARRRNDKGVVVVKFKVGKRGDVSAIEVVDAPSKLLEVQVTDAVAIWEFEPLLRGGQAIEHEFRFELLYKLF